MSIAAQITAERRARQQAEMTEITSAHRELIQVAAQIQRKLDCYEYSEENLEFLSNPHQIAAEEQLSQEEIDDIWRDVAASLMLTPAWCLTARIEFTLSLGDRFETFRQLVPRLTGQHKEKFKAIGCGYAPRDQMSKYLELAANT